MCLLISHLCFGFCVSPPGYNLKKLNQGYRIILMLG